MTQLPLCRLIDLANSADCCHIAPGAVNDEQLGHFYVEGGVFTAEGYVI